MKRLYFIVNNIYWFFYIYIFWICIYIDFFFNLWMIIIVMVMSDSLVLIYKTMIWNWSNQYSESAWLLFNAPNEQFLSYGQ